MAATKRELETEKDALERLKREANGKFDQDRATINQLKDEIIKHKTKLDECRTQCEEDRNKMEQRIEEIRREREAAQTEIENLKVQIHLSEDKMDSINNQLNDTLRKLKEGIIIRLLALFIGKLSSDCQLLYAKVGAFCFC